MHFGKHSLGAAALVAMNAAGSLAASDPYCVGPGSNLCFSWGIPEAAVQSGEGNVYFQMRAPSSYTWLGLGIGSRMNGAEIFLMYADGNGNVTVSPRRGTGHVMPQYSQRSFELLEGSGIENDTMVANIRCRDCSSLKLGGSNNWISAWQEGEPLDSTEIDASITKHDDKEQFEVDFAQASISSDANPFVGGDTNNNSGNGNGSGGGSNTPVVTGGGGGGGSSNTLPWAHGIIMMLVFVVMYPVGGILMPALGKWFIHASWQMVAFLAMWAGLGIGYTMARRQGIPALGFVHHLSFRKHQRRGLFSFFHVWFGRCVMILGIVNGGLGLMLADSSRAFLISYIVIAAIFAGLYFASVPYTEYRKTKATRQEKPVSSPAMAQDST
ncbi:hypothetical protein K4F52_007279 [Lecanicillium sp. MT-2017a]|nr:hypothetical protein K4F52_007279 [Lecanicillium sp. MT-2017a]